MSITNINRNINRSDNLSMNLSITSSTSSHVLLNRLRNINNNNMCKNISRTNLLSQLIKKNNCTRYTSLFALIMRQPRWTHPSRFLYCYLFIQSRSEWYSCFAYCVSVMSRFVKLCKDVGFIGAGNHMTTTDADLIFQKTKRAGNYGKRICYEDFRMVAIPEMAKRMRCQ